MIAEVVVVVLILINIASETNSVIEFKACGKSATHKR